MRGFIVLKQVDQIYCTTCGEWSHKSNFYASQLHELTGWCKECSKFDRQCKYLQNKTKILKQVLRYDKHNKEQVNARIKRWQTKNPDKCREMARNNQRHRLKTDILFKLTHVLRARLHHFIKRATTKKCKFKDYIGCSTIKLKSHLEKQFTAGMTWENHGLHGWHIDHIIPLSSAKNETELYKLCHYKNLQPLWAADNFKKGAKLNYKVKKAA